MYIEYDSGKSCDMFKLKEPRVVTDMGDGGSTTDDDHSSDVEVPAFLVDDEQVHQNKRKLSRMSSVEISPTLQQLTSFSHDDKLEEESRNLHYTDEEWQTGPAQQMNAILKKNLHEIFSSAIQKLVEQGYSKGNATRAVIHTGIPPGWKDVVSSVVDGALEYLNRVEYLVPKYGLEKLVGLTIVGLVNRFCTVRDVHLPLHDVMWCLLMNDLNLLNACGLGENVPGTSSALPESKSGIPIKSRNSGNLSNPGKSVLPSVPRPAATTQESETHLERLAGLKKVATAVSRNDFHRPRCYSIDRSKTRIATVPIRAAKVSAWGSVVVDQPLSSLAGSSSSSESIKNNHPNSSSSTPNPVPEKVEEVSVPPNPSLDYKNLIPYDETLKKYIPQDERDKAVLALLAQTEVLEKELHNWTEWANDKVMQATRRLVKDRAEMRMLKKDREDQEKLVKERVVIEEKTFKRLKEMEYALANANEQIEMSKVTVRNLEEDQNYLQRQWNLCDLESLKATERLKENISREMKALAKIQMADKEKGEFLDKLKDVLSEKSKFENKQRKVKECVDRFKALSKQEEKENEKIRDQIASIKAKKEAEEAFQQQEADDLGKVAEIQLRDTKKKIGKLEKSISEMEVEALKAKIANLKIGYGMSGESSATQSKSVARECVMCMNDEIAVVFLPCSHQILCGDCSVRHERKGMKDCPSCRTVIERRIPIGYAAIN